MAGEFVLKRSIEQFIFSLRAGNSEIILTSERYTRKESALEGIGAVRTNVDVDARFERRDSVGGQPYFVLRGSNGEVIGTSETYSSRSAREGGIRAVKATAPIATINDQT